MFGYLNEDSLQRIHAISIRLKLELAGTSCEISSYQYDIAGTYAIKVVSEEKVKNLFLFRPHAGMLGTIDTIEVYGAKLQKYYAEFLKTKLFYGLSITDVHYVEGSPDFLELYLR
jgi:hypothetical protein